jgi:hypothetical protein
MPRVVKKINKEDLSDKIYNPETKRYVLKTGKIGQLLLKQNKEEIKEKTCPDDKILNPKTNRCVLKTSKIGQELLKEVKIEEKKEIKKDDKSSSIKEYDYKNNIQRFNNYNLITEYLNNEVKLKNNNCIKYYENKQYLLGDTILLYKQFGSDSKHGIIFKCKYLDEPYELPKITAKIQLKTKEAMKEIKILKEITKYGITNKIPNLPILYKTIECENNAKGNDKYPSLLSNAKGMQKYYLIILNELANGDLKSFIQKYRSYFNSVPFWKNLYEQLYISLLILHSLGISHNDSHAGNFLYHKIKAGGCFHYKINGIDYYIENIGFLWTTWDYGISLNLFNHGFYVNDYMRINTALRKNDPKIMTTKEYLEHPEYIERDWGFLPDEIEVPEYIQKLQKILFNQTGGFHKANDMFVIMKLKLTEDLWFKYLLDNEYLFSKKPIGEIISSVDINIATTDFKENHLYKKDPKFIIKI